MNQTIKLEIEGIEVDLNCTLSVENDGIGAYEFWGNKGYDAGHDYLATTAWEYDESKYTPEEITIIEKYLDGNAEEIDSKAVKAYETENKND